jgi:hypothetical protein
MTRMKIGGRRFIMSRSLTWTVENMLKVAQTGVLTQSIWPKLGIGHEIMTINFKL